MGGAGAGLAAFFRGPGCGEVDSAEEAGAACDGRGFADWWARVQGLDAYQATAPASD